MITKPYAGIQINPPRTVSIKRRYSLTSDVVAFRRCARQYGAFAVHSYAPAQQTQIWYGTVLHQVLDRCHAYYRGVPDHTTAGKIPDGGRLLSDTDLENYFHSLRSFRRGGSRGSAPAAPSDVLEFFTEVENGLRSQGIRAISPELWLQAARVLQRFNALEGPALYQRVRDTEHRLQADKGSHILYGVVDLLVSPGSGRDDPSECEIWDYKGIRATHLKPNDRQLFEFQMQVYAHLYEQRHGVLPRKALLYFINELDGSPAPTHRPVNATLEVKLDPAEIARAVAAFAKTVAEIEGCRSADRWPEAAPGVANEQDCTICDLRWDCPTMDGKAPMRYP